MQQQPSPQQRQYDGPECEFCDRPSKHIIENDDGSVWFICDSERCSEDADRRRAAKFGKLVAKVETPFGASAGLPTGAE